MLEALLAWPAAERGAMAVAACVVLATAVAVWALTRTTKKKKKHPVILGMATGNPPYKVSQLEALAIAESCPECRGIKPVLARIYGNSRIDYRYMAVPDFSAAEKRNDERDPLFFPEDKSFRVPIETRLEKFREKALPLVTRICGEALKNADVEASEVGKVVVVSSTGFLGPGLDCELIKSLGLDRSVDRSLIGFMGCAAAINGFRVANDYAVLNDHKVSLLCCVELSSVHTTFDDNVNDAILHAIFADGCAAAVIGNTASRENLSGKMAITDTYGSLMQGTEDGITLSINENGISCVLSKYLPQYIAKNMGAYVDAFLAKNSLRRADLDFWAIHPGGRRIIEEAQNGLGLTADQAKYSWTVLKNYGNMLSPSVMFVLQLILNDKSMNHKRGIAFSFSPGVGAEGILIEVLD